MNTKVLFGIVLLLVACSGSDKKNPTDEQEALANDYFQRAKKYFDQQDYATSVSLLDSALLFQSDHVSSMATRASAHYNLGNMDEALKDYDKAIELWPIDEANKTVLTALYFERGDTYYSSKKFDQAISDFTKAIEMDSTNALAFMYRGDARDYTGLHQEAIADYTKAIELNPTDGTAFFNRGVTKQNLKDEKGACEDFKKAVELGEKEAETFAASCK